MNHDIFHIYNELMCIVINNNCIEICSIYIIYVYICIHFSFSFNTIFIICMYSLFKYLYIFYFYRKYINSIIFN